MNSNVTREYIDAELIRYSYAPDNRIAAYEQVELARRKNGGSMPETRYEFYEYEDAESDRNASAPRSVTLFGTHRLIHARGKISSWMSVHTPGKAGPGSDLVYTYDLVTALYDYGFRDYAPQAARFTTVDPIRDGTNWIHM
ncbi:MAG: hypothetical protein ACOCVC_04090 [Spirochaeta sp.]